MVGFLSFFISDICRSVHLRWLSGFLFSSSDLSSAGGQQLADNSHLFFVKFEIKFSL